VHCVMHKCIMVKVGVNENHRIYATESMYKTRKFYEIKGENLAKQGRMKHLVETEGNWAERTRIGGNFKFVVDDLKKGHKKFWRMKTEFFLGKGKTGKIFDGV